MDIAQAAFATFGEQYGLPRLRQVVQQIARLRVENHGANRHSQRDVFATLAVAVAGLAALTILREVFFGKTVVNQRVQIFVGHGINTAATPAVATVRSAVRFVFFTAKTRHAIATITGDDFDFGFIYKFHILSLRPAALMTMHRRTVNVRNLCALPAIISDAPALPQGFCRARRAVRARD